MSIDEKALSEVLAWMVARDMSNMPPRELIMAYESAKETQQPVEITRPSLSLLCKLASLAVHADELLSSDGHKLDRLALIDCINDVEVRDWIAEMTKNALAPVRRKS